jgi:SHS2 domain-containing protein
MPAPRAMFELFEHTADLGLRVQAGTLEELLAEAARGLLAMLLANPEAVRPVVERSITIAADEPSYLLFDWLSELLYTFETDKLLLAEFDLQWRAGELQATCRGEPMDESRHKMEHEVKAITYHGLRVEETLEGWRAEVIVDI